MYNTLIIVGNVGKDPEMRFIPSGTAVTSFSMATNSQYTNQAGEVVKETTWFRVTTWGKQAEVCNQYVKKGMTVLVEGKLTPDKKSGGPRVFQKQDGSYSATYEVNASTVRFLSHKDGDGSKANDNPFATAAPEMTDGDDIPF
jgi:single-strand DNA-binding protein